MFLYKSVLSRLFLYGIIGIAFFGSALFSVIPRGAAETALPEEALVDLMKPSIVRIAEHVSGTAKIPEIKVDIRKRSITVVPHSYTEVTVDEYLVGSGFIVHPDGYIATNAHIVSQETVKQMLASENALSALYGNALFLSDAEMQDFLQSETDNSFSKEVLRSIVEHSVFALQNTVAVLRPDSTKKNIPDLLAEGFPATVVSVNDNFLEDARDIALLKIEETRLPALRLGSGETLAVGKRTFILGFPATAELNQNSILEATFTQGVVSAIKQSAHQDFKVFQTDAKVSEGSSGGPLFDDRGLVAGIITFQTDEMSRTQGDNFAFALPIEIIQEGAQTKDVLPYEGSYGTLFRKGFDYFALKRCDKALDAFRLAIGESNRVFVSEKYLAAYFKKCDEWKKSGISLDTPFDEWRGKTQMLGSPFLYLFGISLILFGIFGAAIVWLLRQVHREEHEIAFLEDRLKMDEMRLRKYQTEVTSPEHFQQHKTPHNKELTSHRREHKKIV